MEIVLILQANMRYLYDVTEINRPVQ